jgi:hypothetical protein
MHCCNDVVATKIWRMGTWGGQLGGQYKKAKAEAKAEEEAEGKKAEGL